MVGCMELTDEKIAIWSVVCNELVGEMETDVVVMSGEVWANVGSGLVVVHEITPDLQLPLDEEFKYVLWEY